MEEHSKNIVLITGIDGFTGKYLEKYLSGNGFTVFGTTLSTTSNTNYFQVDVLSEESLDYVLEKVKPKYVIHLAAISFVASENKRQIYDVNVFGTLNLLTSLKKLKHKPLKIIIASSATVYGNIEGGIDESMCPKPINHYGNSKLVMENMSFSFQDSLNVLFVRPFNYTGVGQENNFLVPKIVSHFKNNEKDIYLGNIDVYREFNDVRYVVRCYAELLKTNKESSNIVNVCTGNAVNIRKIIGYMEIIAGYKINVRINPEFVRKNEIKVLKGNPAKLLDEIGDFRSDFNLYNTLLEMYNN